MRSQKGNYPKEELNNQGVHYKTVKQHKKKHRSASIILIIEREAKTRKTLSQNEAKPDQITRY